MIYFDRIEVVNYLVPSAGKLMSNINIYLVHDDHLTLTEYITK